MSICIQAITQTESAINEDTYGFTSTEAWVLDGATSISGRRKEIDDVLHTDASWFVRRVSDGIKQSFGSFDLRSSMVPMLRSISGEANGVWGQWSATDTPSASLCHVRFQDNQATFSNLGDCRIIYQLDNCEIETFGTCDVQILDADLLENFKSLRTEYPDSTHKEIWDLVVPQIRKNRSLMNNPAGYWILSPDAAGVQHTQELTVQYNQSLRVFLASDGLYRLVDTYSELTISDFFNQAFEKGGLEQLVTRLRNIEARDPNATTFQRVKLKDDATGLSIRIQIES